jgi:hypothetical protein
LQDAYFLLVLYPAVCPFKMNEKVLGAKLGKMDLANDAQKEIQAMTLRYNEKIAGGQWRDIIDWRPRQQPAFLDPDALLRIQLKSRSATTGCPALTVADDVTEIDLSRPVGTHDAPQAAIAHWRGLGFPHSVGRTPLFGPAYEPDSAP